MAMKPFNSVGGLSVGSNGLVVLEADGSANLANVTVNGSFQLASGELQLGDIADVHIDGGSNGQYLATDGTGNLSWVTLDTDTLSNGSSNVSIDSADGDVTVSVDGEANIAVFTSSGLTVNGTLDASFVSGDGSALGNITGANVTGDVAGANHANIADVASSVDAANVSGTVGSAQVAYSVDGANVSGTVGTASIAYGVDGANVAGQVSSAANADVAYSVDAANVSGTVGSASVAYSVDAANVSGTVSSASVAYSVDAANVSGTVGSATVAYSIDGANVSGDVAGANHANIADIAYSVDSANIVGQVANAAQADVALSVAGANVSGDVAGANHANVADVAYSVSGANVSGNVAGASTAYALNADVANVAISGGTSGLVLTTNGSGSLSWTNSNLKYTREWHIDSTVGNDTTGDGSYNRPFATIAKVKAVIGTQTGQTIYLHNSVYSENVTWTVGNTDFVYNGDGGVAFCTGTWAFSHSTPGSVRVLNLQFEGIVTVSGTGSTYFGSCNLVGGLNKTGNGYIEMRNDTMVSDTTSFVSITGSGIVNMLGGAANSITVNNAGAQFIARDATLAIITVTSGLALVDTSFIYSATATSNAVTSTPAGIFYAYNSHFVTSTGALSRLSLAGAWSINDTQYDKANSTLTGTNLGTVSYSDAVNIQGLANVASLQVRGTSTLGAVGNVSISGGTTGQYLQTNGSGTLSWTTVELANIHNGTSNVAVAADGDITIASNGQANIVTVSSNGTFATTTINDDVIVTGNFTVQGTTNSVNVTELNIKDPIITEGRGTNNAPLTTADGKDRGLFSYYYDGAEKGAFIGVMTTGAHAGEYVVSTDAVVVDNVVTTSSYGNIVVGNVIGNLANGGTSVGIAAADANITMSVDETANVVVVSAEGITVDGTVTVGGTGIGGATLTTTDTTTVALATVVDTAGLAVEFLVKGSDSTGAKFEVATLLLISDGAGSVDYTIYGSTSVGGTTGILSATRNGALVELNVTPASSNSTVWTVQYRSI